MSAAEELLNSLTEDVPQHTHSLVDTDSYFVIDPSTKEITNDVRKHYIMQGNHNSEVYTFELPRYIDGHDMLLCNQVKIRYSNTTEDGLTTIADVADASALCLKNENEDAVICTWEIDRKATQLAGVLSFHLQYLCTTFEGVVVYEWWTDTYDKVEIKATNSNSQRVVAEYSDILEEWRAKLFGAGESVISDISQTADDKVKMVQQEGTKQTNVIQTSASEQRSSVEAKGAEVRATIPEDYSTTYNMADEAVRTKANGIECEVAGSYVAITDASTDHIRNLQLFGKTTQFTTTGKNLFGGDALADKLVQTMSAVKDTDNGTVTYISGKSNNIEIYSNFKENTQYTFIWFGSNTGGTNSLNMQLEYTDGSKKYVYTPSPSKDAYTVLVTDPGKTVKRLHGVHNSYSTKLYYNQCGIFEGIIDVDNFEIYTGGKPAPNPEYPQELVSVGSTGNIKTYVAGKNLCLPSIYESMSINVPAYTQYDPATHKVSITGSATGNPGVYCQACKNMVVGQKYTISFDIRGTAGKKAVCGWDKQKTVITLSETYTRYSETIVSARTAELITFYSMSTASGGLGAGEWLQFDNVQVEAGDKATSYAPYVDISSLSVPTNTALPGIPVTSGGNYTDTNGQQWICDEIDFERGVYVKRVNAISDNGAAKWTTTTGWPGVFYRNLDDATKTLGIPVLCKAYNGKAIGYTAMTDGDVTLYQDTTHNYVNSEFQWLYIRDNRFKTADALRAYLSDNPLSIQYVLREPVETTLDGTIMAAFKALHTNYPNTTILNDAGAWMSVKYNADTKTYVENPKVLKLVDSSTGVVYELKIVDGAISIDPV